MCEELRDFLLNLYRGMAQEYMKKKNVRASTVACVFQTEIPTRRCFCVHVG